MFRDVVVLQYGRHDLVNSELAPELETLAGSWSPQRTLAVLDKIALTRRNLEQNVAPALALESLLVTVASGRTL
jgi:DNA polymerase-3 subunit delta'